MASYNLSVDKCRGASSPPSTPPWLRPPRHIPELREGGKEEVRGKKKRREMNGEGGKRVREEEVIKRMNGEEKQLLRKKKKQLKIRLVVQKHEKMDKRRRSKERTRK